MSSDVVRLLKIGDFAQVKGGKRMPAGTALTAEKTRHPYLRIVDFKDGSIDKSNLQYVPDEVFPSIARYIIDSDDLYISIVGTIGLVGKVPVELSGANLTENAAKICQIDSTVINRDYLGYFLRSEMGQGAISSMTVGSTQPKLALFRIEQIEVPCPALDIQESIVGVLNALDDRITLLRETNTTLEAIAQALFKSWFVDFDPVHAKMQGRAPEGMDQATAALFPDSFEDSELGPVPKGWCVGTIGDIASVIDCLHSKKPELIESPHPFLQLSNIRDDGLLDTSEVAGISESDYKKWISRIEVGEGDCVITNVGRVGAVAQIPANYKAAMGRNMTAVRLKKEYPYPTYLIELLQSPWMRAEIDAKTDVGTILNALNVRSIPLLRCVLASRNVLAEFESVTRPLRAMMEANIIKIQTLSKIRDTLLPRLISGQLQLGDAHSVLAG